MKVELTRTVTFSSGHRYWRPELSRDENVALFGKWASPYSHGHNYVLDVSLKGDVDPRHGMVVNIKLLDALIREKVVGILDQRSLNDEIPNFVSVPPSTENLLAYIFESLGGAWTLELGGTTVELTELRLSETTELWATLTKDKRMTLTKTYEFAASHRLHLPALSQAENDELFGKCNNPAGHGHNYIVEVTVAGDPDPRTGFVADLGKLDLLVEREILNRYDHKNLSLDLPEFADKNATTEVLALEIFRRLDPKTKQETGANLEKILVRETARSSFSVSSSDFAVESKLG